MGAVLHKYKVHLQSAVSQLSIIPGFQYCILSYFELTEYPDTHGTHGVKILHLSAGVTIPSRTQECSVLLSSHLLSSQATFSLLMQQDPLCRASSAGRGGGCDLALAADLPVHSRADNSQLKGTAELLRAPVELH